MLAGDGIGPEISTVGVDVMTAVCEKFGHKVNYEYAICGADAIDKVGDPFPETTYEACKNADAVLFSAVGDPKFDNDPTAKVRPEQGLLAMRKKLGLFANIRPVQTFKCLLHKSPLRAELVDGADFLCIRELTGGMYFGEKYQDNDKAYDTNMYTRPEIERILKVGFEYAMKRNKHLTVVDKANVLASSRLWRQIAQEMAPQYPEVTTDYMFVDNAAMKMIQEPKFFDVMVTENTFGDILTDEGSCISGSMGLLPSASTGESTPVFEPIHGSWPQAKGLNIANPLAQILSVAMLFEYFDLKEEGLITVLFISNFSLQSSANLLQCHCKAVTVALQSSCSTTANLFAVTLQLVCSITAKSMHHLCSGKSLIVRYGSSSPSFLLQSFHILSSSLFVLSFDRWQYNLSFSGGFISWNFHIFVSISMLHKCVREECIRQ